MISNRANDDAHLQKSATISSECEAEVLTLELLWSLLRGRRKIKPSECLLSLGSWHSAGRGKVDITLAKDIFTSSMSFFAAFCNTLSVPKQTLQPPEKTLYSSSETLKVSNQKRKKKVRKVKKICAHTTCPSMQMIPATDFQPAERADVVSL